jgi:hypothetical protein
MAIAPDFTGFHTLLCVLANRVLNQAPVMTPAQHAAGQMMSVFYDHNLIARILLSLATLGYAAVTILADFNRTHATNPKWTPHARFHVVWQISSYIGVGLIALGLIWTPGPLTVERLYLAGALAAAVYVGFFAALLTMPIYGGAAYDTNGYQPFKAPIPLIAPRWDANITAFTLQIVFLVGGLLTVTATGGS